MSSILNALKKLENKFPQQNGSHSWPEQLGSDTAPQNEDIWRRLFNSSTLLFALLILLTIGAGLFARRHFIAHWDSVSPAIQEPTRESITNNRPALAEPGADELMKQAETTHLAKQKTKNIPVIVNNRKKRIIADYSSAGSDVEKNMQLSRDSASFAKNTRNSVVENRPELTYEKLENSSLKLQAITWDSNPTDRFALINNRIVRLGDSIDNFSITYIGMDYIAVRKNGKNWRIQFRIR